MVISINLLSKAKRNNISKWKWQKNNLISNLITIWLELISQWLRQDLDQKLYNWSIPEEKPCLQLISYWQYVEGWVKKRGWLWNSTMSILMNSVTLIIFYGNLLYLRFSKWGVNTVLLKRVQYFVLFNYSYKSWSIIKTRNNFGIYSSWGFQNCPWKLNMAKICLR